MNETDFIAALRALPLHPGARNLDDDCAVLTLGDETLVINHDMMAEGTHFAPDTDRADVAWKLVATNLSDLAAKGAEPVGVLLGHTLGAGDARFIKGLREALSAFGAPLLGGDTIAGTGPATYGLTAIGRATCLPVPARSGTRLGDAIYLTGPVGRAMLGFEGQPAHRAAFNRPLPRIAEGIALAPHVHTMTDVSDGLLLECWRMARLNGVTFALDPAAIPVADPARRDDCVRWGDDYELLCAAEAAVKLPVTVHRIGTVVMPGRAPVMLGRQALRDPATLGYRHG